MTSRVKEFQRMCDNINENGGYNLGEWHTALLAQIAQNLAVIADAIMADRKGEWIRTGRTNIYGGIEVQCSNCGDKVMVQHLEDEWFCRHCGADMGMKGADYEID